MIIVSVLLFSGCFKEESAASEASYSHSREITDAAGRTVSIWKNPKRVICSGAGTLRLLTYLNATDRVVGVDDVEKRENRFESRPYALAHKEFRDLPLIGEYRGNDNAELIASLEPQPEVIFKSYSGTGVAPDDLQRKTGISVITIEYGDLTNNRESFYKSLRLMGHVLGLEARADSVIAFFDSHIAELEQLTGSIPVSQRRSPYVGGVAFRGARGIRSTEFYYPPFEFTGTPHVGASEVRENLGGHADLSQEQLLAWNPSIIFLDLSTTRADINNNGLNELATSPVYRELDAVKNGEIYGVLPYNFYTTNFGSVLANCYYVGKVLYPEAFAGIDPVAKADEIYTFLVGKPVFHELNGTIKNLGFTKIDPEQYRADQ